MFTKEEFGKEVAAIKNEPSAKAIVFLGSPYIIIPLSETFVKFLKSKLPEEAKTLSVLSNITHTFFWSKYLHENIDNMNDVSRMALLDGMSLTELGFIAMSDFDVYINTAVAGMETNPDLWISLLQTSAQNVVAYYVHTEYEEYLELIKDNSASIIATKDEFIDAQEKIKEVVNRINFFYNPTSKIRTLN